MHICNIHMSLPVDTIFNDINNLIELADYALMPMSRNQAVSLVYIIFIKNPVLLQDERQESMSCWANYKGQHESPSPHITMRRTFTYRRHSNVPSKPSGKFHTLQCGRWIITTKCGCPTTNASRSILLLQLFHSSPDNTHQNCKQSPTMQSGPQCVREQTHGTIPRSMVPNTTCK